MMATLPRFNRPANRHAGKILLFGLAAVAAYNWRQWQRDKALLAEKRQPEPLPPLESWSALPSVSMLVAAWNEADNIERHIESFQRLRYPHKQLILCAGGADGTYELALRHSGENINVLEQQPGEGKQRALRRGFDRAHGEIIFLTDADCLLADEPFERTLWPVASGREQAATGGSRPLDRQLSDPFVFSQAASQVYGALHGPEHNPGILGRNCAVRRALLEATGALDSLAPTGTDYVLAKTLDAAGIAIRQVPHSRMPTEFPSTVSAYLLQQRRWLRNVALHGQRFGAAGEVRAVLRSSLVGLGMLLLPLIGLLLSPWLLSLWGILAGQVFLARLRYLAFAGAVLDRPMRPVDMAWQAPLLWLDFVAWAQLLVDYVSRKKWWEW